MVDARLTRRGHPTCSTQSAQYAAIAKFAQSEVKDWHQKEPPHMPSEETIIPPTERGIAASEGVTSDSQEPTALQVVAARLSEVALLVEVLEEALEELSERVTDLERLA